MTNRSDTICVRERNQELFRREFADNAALAEARPVQIDFETTTRCNLRCLTCPKTYAKASGRDASRELFDKVAEATFATAASVNLSGYGEPMMSPHFEYFYRRSIAAGLNVGFITNGTHLNEAWLERISPDPAHLFLSIDAADPATMKLMRPQLDFSALERNLKLYRAIMDRNGAAHRARLYFQFVPTLLNIDSLPRVVEWAAEAGACRVEVFNFRTAGLSDDAARAHLSNDPDRARRNFESASALAAELGIRLVLPLGFSRGVTPADANDVAAMIDAPTRSNPHECKYPLACSAPWFRVNIYETGDVRPCCWYPFPMGNLFRQSFEEIWNGPKYRQFRTALNSGFPHLGCKTCLMIWGITAGRPDLIFQKERGLDLLHTALQRARRRVDDFRTSTDLATVVLRRII